MVVLLTMTPSPVTYCHILYPCANAMMTEICNVSKDIIALTRLTFLNACATGSRKPAARTS